MSAIHRAELTRFYDHSIFCPFCGQKVIDMETGGDAGIHPCPHCLFVATDAGFEYRSERFDENINSQKLDEDELEGSIDELTDRVTIPDAVKFAAYVPAPGFLGCYYGFAPR
ncbi:hypothetical protein [Spongorhabdus nitratireducens]